MFQLIQTTDSAALASTGPVSGGTTSSLRSLLQVADINTESATNPFAALVLQQLEQAPVSPVVVAQTTVPGLPGGNNLPPLPPIVDRPPELNPVLTARSGDEGSAVFEQRQAPALLSLNPVERKLPEQNPSIPTSVRSEERVALEQFILDDNTRTPRQATVSMNQTELLPVRMEKLMPEITSAESAAPLPLSQPATLHKTTQGMTPLNVPGAQMHINTPVQSNQWADQLNGRVALLLQNNQQQAHISVHPAELGPIEVKISMQNDQASISFVTQNSVVREAVEDAIPRLRDMLQESGVNLGQSNVSEQRSGESQDDSQSLFDRTLADGSIADEHAVNDAPSQQYLSRGLVDHFI